MTSLLLTPIALLRRHVVRPVVAPLGLRAPSPLAGRRVLITGASSGIGEATAYAVAQRGARLVLVARRADELKRVVAAIEEAGGEAEAHVVDLTDGAAVDAMIAEVLEGGPVDYLVNNAGRSIRRSLELSYDRMHDFERTMAINYFGPVRLILGLLPAMREQGFGHVVNVVTWGVQIKAPKFAAYIASKTALDSFARIAGREAWKDNVTFTNIRLSLVRTVMVAPTEAYAKARAESPEQAAAKIVRALEDRPLTVNTVAASVVEVLNLTAPRFTDFAFAAFDKRFPDSAAARKS
ncbi:short-subunit dehydrogenase [Nocardioides daedukensis]|uniref:Short-subunit dehydrogenase n=1 Tax=Nocardioides daedukensis TaxID=634462 RepID=A0A7Y9S5C2_9ACTN|nr:short-subunit dehydrogenase [Nocardioides daedukensis]